MLVRPQMVVPDTKFVEPLLTQHFAAEAEAFQKTDGGLEGAEEAFDSSVLPGCEGSGAD